MMIKAVHHHHRAVLVSGRCFGAASAEVSGGEEGMAELASLTGAGARGRLWFLCRCRFVELILLYLSHFVIAFKKALIDLGASFTHGRGFQRSNHHKFDSVLLD